MSNPTKWDTDEVYQDLKANPVRNLDGRTFVWLDRYYRYTFVEWIDGEQWGPEEKKAKAFADKTVPTVLPDGAVMPK